MPKYRQLHTKLVDSRDLNDMPDDFTRLFYITLITVFDSAGRAIDNSAWLRSKCFPLREDVELQKIKDAMIWFEERGLIIRYQVKADKFFWCPSFLKLQSGLDKETPSTFPAPTPEQVQSYSEPTPEQARSYSVPMQCNAIQDNTIQDKAGAISTTPPFPIVTSETYKNDPWKQEWMLDVWFQVTGLTSFTGDNQKIIEALDGLRYRRIPPFKNQNEMIAYLKPYCEHWQTLKTKDGRFYSKRNPAWLERAVAGDPLPTDKKPVKKPDPGCQKCGGAGFYKNQTDDIHDPQFGKVVMCECVRVREEVTV